MQNLALWVVKFVIESSIGQKIGLYWSLIIDVVVKKAASDAVFTISFELKNKDNNTGQTVMPKNSLVMYVKSISLI